MAKKKFDSNYIENAEKMLDDVMYEEPAAQDWTQFSLNVRQVMRAVATIYGNNSDEDTDRLNRLLHELTFRYVLPNMREWDISYTKKETTN